MAKADNNEYTLKEYKCGYPGCGHEWKQYVRRLAAGSDVVTGRQHRHSVSSQVQCPICKNGCKTWEEGKEIEKVTIKGSAYQRVVKSKVGEKV